MRTAIVLFTRDLRVHDHPALHAAVAEAEQVVPLFVLDEGVWAAGYARPNRVAFLLDCLEDLRGALRDRGGALAIRRGDVVEEALRLAGEVDAGAIHASADVSYFAQRRERRLARACAERRLGLRLHPGVTVVPPGELTPAAGDHFRVYTPYWRAWRETPLRAVVPAPERVVVPEGLSAALSEGRVPGVRELVDGPMSPELPAGGEGVGRRRLDAWLDGDVAGYADDNDDLAADATSRLSPYLHFGCLSPREIVARADRRRKGVDAFVRQLCWRDFHHQVLAARPASAWRDYRSRDDEWDRDESVIRAWQDGRTGYPIVDAGMRQLRREGWMHNRARLLTASFLTKDCYVDWRRGAAHFLDWLVDGDVADNQMNWQWVAGTGTDTRPNRIFNPVTQARRFDPDGAYVRRYVPELASIEGPAVHEPWKLGPLERDRLDYPDPLVDHAEAAARFRERRRG